MPSMSYIQRCQKAFGCPKKKERVFSRDDLLNLAWGYDYVGDEKGVNFHIMNLRRKLNVDYIETVRGVGYKIAKEN